MRRLSTFLLFTLCILQLKAQVRYRPLLAPLSQKPTQALLALGCCAHAVARHHKRKSRTIVATQVPQDKKSKKQQAAETDPNFFATDLPYKKFKHELVAQSSGAVGSALFLCAGNYILMSHLHHHNYLPPFNKKNGIKAFAHILGGWSGVQFFLLPYGVCKFLALSPEWVKFLADPTGKVKLVDRLKKIIAAKINKKEDSKLVKLAAKIAHAALMKDIGDDAEYIEAIAKKRAWQYGWAIAICAEWALLAAAYLACAS